jgi:hypothetical protein
MPAAAFKIIAYAIPTFLLTTITASAQGHDQQLLSLVPEGVPLVAEMSAPTKVGQPDSYLLLTRDNTEDMAEFLALSGVDSSQQMHQVIYLAGGGQGVGPKDHSLLVSGHFDRDRIFRAAVFNGASMVEFLGVPVLVVSPPARELNIVHEPRWLAVQHSTTAIFGSEASVREEIARELAGKPADVLLMKRLARLRPQDDIWCMIVAPSDSAEIRQSLQALNPALPGLLHEGDEFQFGIHYGTHVEFEYEVTSATAASFAPPLVQSLQGNLAKSIQLLPQTQPTTKVSSVKGVIKISRGRYEAWLKEILARKQKLVTSPQL